ncbi:MAG TPA: transglycosylase SLT domain-containing protein [Candidatus Binataceae bacterium]|nr:transglycosylase SLT domain-containing protein [Candidatus Binataceae bacterium]
MASGRKILSAFQTLLLALIIGAAGVAVVPSGAQALGEVPFPKPKAIEPNVAFWVEVFTKYSVRDFVIHDKDDLTRVYQVFNLPGDGQPGRDDIDFCNNYLRKKYGEILTHLATGAAPADYEERRVAAMFPAGTSPLTYANAADNLRVQEGLRERFRDGLIRARYYQRPMQRIFTAFGLPPELVILAQIESGFSSRAKSGAGATGIWQFTRATGRKYMKITRHRDDRLNPLRETEAAAKLLRYNFDVLGDWPLAITAYDYGTGGMARAAEESGGDYSKLIETYHGPHFGFASRNYYSEFLAALEVHRHEDDYFPELPDMAPGRVLTAEIKAAKAAQRTAPAQHGLHKKSTQPVSAANLAAAKTPGGQQPDVVKATQLAAARPIATKSKQPVTQAATGKATGASLKRYTMRSGDTAYQIASQFGVPVKALLKANRIRHPRELRPGVTLIIPDV